ncbi:hypothetical protein BpHYR1_044797 [Brachionus plicatilis]|uniref:Uncharacterized protein n=1 Tax=Brachionus plicatilis TaxID=10195 RepID=A0A3M7PMT8_BRAPC|nr:hypothetical protein BpHYR1_044797 [Brachionus plicatilis]
MASFVPSSLHIFINLSYSLIFAIFNLNDHEIYKELDEKAIKTLKKIIITYFVKSKVGVFFRLLMKILIQFCESMKKCDNLLTKSL